MSRSPLFYVGDKYKLMPQLLTLFPDQIIDYYEPFYGGGSSQLNVKAEKYYLNDIDENVISIHKLLFSYRNKGNKFIDEILNLIKKYGLSCSYLKNDIPDTLKKKYPKTYFAKYNKEAYAKLKSDYNADKSNVKLLYLLLIYGFNHMIRFNSSGEFNLPVGNVDFNHNVYNALSNYFEIQKNNSIFFSTKDFKQFLSRKKFSENSFVYLDHHIIFH